MIGLEVVISLFNKRQIEIAQQCGFPKQYLTKWINGERPIPEKWLKELSITFDLPEYLFQKELTDAEIVSLKKLRLQRLAEEYGFEIIINSV